MSIKSSTTTVAWHQSRPLLVECQGPCHSRGNRCECTSAGV